MAIIIKGKDRKKEDEKRRREDFEERNIDMYT